jgi:RNA polymerase sigma-70 factor, ECF subfamily
MPAEDELAEPDDVVRRAVLEQFASAIERADGGAMAELLRADAVLEMPPFLTWFAGRDAVARFIGSRLLTAPGELRPVQVTANGQAAFAVYKRDEDGEYQAHALEVLTLTATGISRIVAFADPRLFKLFGLPTTPGVSSGLHK